VGYQSISFYSKTIPEIILLKPMITELSEVIITSKPINARTIVRRALANTSKNYSREDFLQKFFYRHYCKDDSVYGRLIEASVDVLKHQGYRHPRNHSGEHEEIRVNQLRRSLDRTEMAQGHEPISIGNILQADLVAYQTHDESPYPQFYEAASNLKTDFNRYSFFVDGITVYDGQEVYMISYESKKDSILTTTGYIPAPSAKGLLYISVGNYAFIKTEDEKQDKSNIIRTTAYYRKFGKYYYPYHFVRDGKNRFADKHQHSFHIEMISVEIQLKPINFKGEEPDKNELLKIPYDSVFWNTTTMLKTTPLEDKIIEDLGGGRSLNEQFYRYQKFQWSTTNGGTNGYDKFNWFRNDSEGERILYLSFIDQNCKDYLLELQRIKQLIKGYRSQISFIIITVENDESTWQQLIDRFSLYTDGIINYRIDDKSDLLKTFKVKALPSFALIARDGNIFALSAPHPTDAQLEKDFSFLIAQSLEQ